jgi:tripartite-type tricarboxylate transporter receptor subunit TctC
MNFRPLLLVAARCIALTAAMLAMPIASSNEYPDRPIRLIVPFPPGGGADNLARMIMPKVAEHLGQPIVIENKPGAGGNVGAEQVARATPDGYTLLYGTNGTHGINASLYGHLRFDPLKDFVPVSRMTQIAALLIVNPALPVKSVSDLIAYAKANPGKVNFASAGNGTTSHLAGEMFKTMTGLEIVHVPYKGGAAAATDLMAGQVQMMIDVMPNAYPLSKGGKVRGIAVTTRSRFPGAPELPTFAESGLKGFEISAWDGVFAPAGTPEHIVDRLNTAIRKALSDPQLREQLIANGAQPATMTSPEFARFVAEELERWGKLVRSAGAKLD